MKFFINFTVILFCAISANVNAQSKDETKYRKESEEMRKDVWSWDMPEFKTTTVPAEYAKASKVILAQHTELTADSKSKIVFTGFGIGGKKEQTILEVVRERVKLNDKTAVDDYSELSFTQFAKISSGFMRTGKTTSYVGVKVIKPNGKITEINADDIVLVKDESAEKKAKLAIPDLQPGDIIDYFIATEKYLENDFSVKAYTIVLFDDDPILNLSFHGQLGRKFAIEYRSYNGAPDLKVSKNDDKDIVIDVSEKNIPPFETALWVAPARQLPFIRMNIALGAARYLTSTKPGEINKLTETDRGLNVKAASLNLLYYNNYWLGANRKQYKDIVNDAERMAKQMNLRYKDLSDKEKAALLFYTFRFTKLLNFDITLLSKKIDIGRFSFDNNSLNLYCILKAAGIDGSILLSGSRTGFRMNEAMDEDAINAVTYLTGTPYFLNLENVYDIPFSIPSQIEGIKDTRIVTFTSKGNGVRNNIDMGPSVPTSSSDKNAHIENLKLSLSADKKNIAVQRSTTLTGLDKADAQRNLILHEDFYEEERKAFNEKETLMESLEDGRKSKKYADEAKAAFAEARKNQKVAFADEAKDWFGQDIIDLNNYKTDTLGVRHTEPNFVYSSSFNLDGLVKKAGNNFIIEIGKIEGQPLVIKPNQRKRSLDVYSGYARCIEYNIEFEIPDGYTVEGLEALNKNVRNETGYFTAEASTKGKSVFIKLRKYYLHNFEPAKNWDKIIEFTDAAGDWTNSKLLLKKS